MNISAITQNFATSTVKSGNKLPQYESARIDEAAKNTETSSEQIDLRNVSVNEVNSLIKSGKTELLRVAPFIPPNVLEQYNYNSEAIGEHRVDLLGQVETSIEFKKSLDEDTRFLQAVLDSFMKIDGTKFPEELDLVA